MQRQGRVNEYLGDRVLLGVCDGLLGALRFDEVLVLALGGFRSRGFVARKLFLNPCVLYLTVNPLTKILHGVRGRSCQCVRYTHGQHRPHCLLQVLSVRVVHLERSYEASTTSAWQSFEL